MNEIKIFENKEFGEIRTVEVNNVPWFVASDVCKALDIANATQAVQRLDEDERSMFNIGRQGEANIINEYGLYSLVLASRKKEAKEFKRWITHDVIPSIRKHGAYMTEQKIEEALLNPDVLIKLATELKEEREHRKALQTKIEADRPKTIFADAVSSSKTSILIGDMAKILRQNGVEIGQKRLFQWLRDKGYLIRRKGCDYNMPTQRSMEMGLFEIKESTHLDGNGCNVTTKTPKVSGKGQVFFINKFLKTRKDMENA